MTKLGAFTGIYLFNFEFPIFIFIRANCVRFSKRLYIFLGIPCFRVTRALASVSKIVRLNIFGSMFFIHISWKIHWSLTTFYVLVLPSKLDNEALQSALFIPWQDTKKTPLKQKVEHQNCLMNGLQLFATSTHPILVGILFLTSLFLP